MVIEGEERLPAQALDQALAPAAKQRGGGAGGDEDDAHDAHRVEATLLASDAALEQKLAAQLADVANVVLDARRAGCSVLESAASTGRTDILRALLQRFQAAATSSSSSSDSSEAGARLQALIHQDIAAAWLAAADQGQVQSMRLLLDACSSCAAVEELLDVRRSEGCTALMKAAYEGYVDCMQLLLAPDLSPDAQVAAVNTYGCNALLHAAERGHAECMRLLLAHSPAVQLAAESDDLDALGMSAINGHVECLRLALAHSPTQQQLDNALLVVCGRAAALKQKQALRQQLEQQPEPEASEEQLKQSVRQCFELLLAHGAMVTSLATEEHIAMVRPVIKELAARALAPDMANEAVVGLALAAATTATRSRKRDACEKDPAAAAAAAAAAGPVKCSRC